MIAWLKRRWLSFLIRQIQWEMEALETQKELLELAMQDVDQDLIGLHMRWRRISLQVDSLELSAGASDRTTPRSLFISRQKPGGDSSARLDS